MRPAIPQCTLMGSLQGHLLPPGALKRRDHPILPSVRPHHAHYITTLSNASTLSLSTSRDSDSPTFLGSLFHCLTTLSKNNFFLTSTVTLLVLSSTTPAPPAAKSNQWQLRHREADAEPCLVPCSLHTAKPTGQKCLHFWRGILAPGSNNCQHIRKEISSPNAG